MNTDEITILGRYPGFTENIIAAHHSAILGMAYEVHYTGGHHDGIEIHCQTEASVMTLFDQLVNAHRAHWEHPWLESLAELNKWRPAESW